MNKRVVKRNGDELFPLGIGAMRLPTKNNSIDRESSQEFILYAIENGVNYIDRIIFRRHPKLDWC